MVRDQFRACLELIEGCAQRRVAFFDGLVEPIVGGPLLGHLPYALNRVVLGRVRRQTKQLEPPTVLGEPLLPVFLEVVAGTVVDDQEDLAATVCHELLQELEEREPVEDGSKAVVKPRAWLQRDSAEHVGRLPHAERVYAGLAADTRPRLVERPVEPEAGFVAEGHDASALARFFLIRGNVSRSHVACRARSARASRLR